MANKRKNAPEADFQNGTRKSQRTRKLSDGEKRYRPEPVNARAARSRDPGLDSDPVTPEPLSPTQAQRIWYEKLFDGSLPKAFSFVEVPKCWSTKGILSVLQEQSDIITDVNAAEGNEGARSVLEYVGHIDPIDKSLRIGDGRLKQGGMQPALRATVRTLRDQMRFFKNSCDLELKNLLSSSADATYPVPLHKGTLESWHKAVQTILSGLLDFAQRRNFLRELKKAITNVEAKHQEGLLKLQGQGSVESTDSVIPEALNPQLPIELDLVELWDAGGDLDESTTQEIVDNVLKYYQGEVEKYDINKRACSTFQDIHQISFAIALLLKPDATNTSPLNRYISQEKQNAVQDWGRRFEDVYAGDSIKQIQTEAAKLAVEARGEVLGRAEFRFFELGAKLGPTLCPEFANEAQFFALVPSFMSQAAKEDAVTDLEEVYLEFQSDVYPQNETTYLWLLVWRALKTLQILSGKTVNGFPQKSATAKWTVHGETEPQEHPQSTADVFEIDRLFYQNVLGTDRYKGLYEAILPNGDICNIERIEGYVESYFHHVAECKKESSKYYWQFKTFTSQPVPPVILEGLADFIEAPNWNADSLTFLHRIALRLAFLCKEKPFRRFERDQGTGTIIYCDIQKRGNTPSRDQSQRTSPPPSGPTGAGANGDGRRTAPYSSGAILGRTLGAAAGGSGGDDPNDGRRGGNPPRDANYPVLPAASSSSSESDDETAPAPATEEEARDFMQNPASPGWGSARLNDAETQDADTIRVPQDLSEMLATGRNALDEQENERLAAFNIPAAVAPNLESRDRRSAFPFAYNPMPETRATERAASRQIEREMADAGITTEGPRLSDVENVVPRPVRLPYIPANRTEAERLDYEDLLRVAQTMTSLRWPTNQQEFRIWVRSVYRRRDFMRQSRQNSPLGQLAYARSQILTQASSLLGRAFRRSPRFEVEGVPNLPMSEKDRRRTRRDVLAPNQDGTAGIVRSDNGSRVPVHRAPLRELTPVQRPVRVGRPRDGPTQQVSPFRASRSFARISESRMPWSPSDARPSFSSLADAASPGSMQATGGPGVPTNFPDLYMARSPARQPVSPTPAGLGRSHVNGERVPFAHAPRVPTATAQDIPATTSEPPYQSTTPSPPGTPEEFRFLQQNDEQRQLYIEDHNALVADGDRATIDGDRLHDWLDAQGVTHDSMMALYQRLRVTYEYGLTGDYQARQVPRFAAAPRPLRGVARDAAPRTPPGQVFTGYQSGAGRRIGFNEQAEQISTMSTVQTPPDQPQSQHEASPLPQPGVSPAPPGFIWVGPLCRGPNRDWIRVAAGQDPARRIRRRIASLQPWQLEDVHRLDDEYRQMLLGLQQIEDGSDFDDNAAQSTPSSQLLRLRPDGSTPPRSSLLFQIIRTTPMTPGQVEAVSWGDWRGMPTGGNRPFTLFPGNRDFSFTGRGPTNGGRVLGESSPEVERIVRRNSGNSSIALRGRPSIDLSPFSTIPTFLPGQGGTLQITSAAPGPSAPRTAAGGDGPGGDGSPGGSNGSGGNGGPAGSGGAGSNRAPRGDGDSPDYGPPGSDSPGGNGNGGSNARPAYATQGTQTAPTYATAQTQTPRSREEWMVMTLPQLKEEMTRRGLPFKGLKKAGIVDALTSDDWN